MHYIKHACLITCSVIPCLLVKYQSGACFAKIFMLTCSKLSFVFWHYPVHFVHFYEIELLSLALNYFDWIHDNSFKPFFLLNWKTYLVKCHFSALSVSFYGLQTSLYGTCCLTYRFIPRHVPQFIYLWLNLVVSSIYKLCLQSELLCLILFMRAVLLILKPH